MAAYEFKEEHVDETCCGTAMEINGNVAICAKCGNRKEVRVRLIKEDNDRKSVLGRTRSV